MTKDGKSANTIVLAIKPRPTKLSLRKTKVAGLMKAALPTGVLKTMLLKILPVSRFSRFSSRNGSQFGKFRDAQFLG